MLMLGLRYVKRGGCHQMISRQRKYQLRHQELGLCHQCGEKVYGGTRFCREHLTRVRERNRKAHGCEEWQVGKRGRIPTEERAC
jgi:hypothetical protein